MTLGCPCPYMVSKGWDMREQRSPGCWHLSTPPRYAHLCTQLCREGKGLGYGQGTKGGRGVGITSQGHHHSWHQVILEMGLGTHLSPTLGLCWGMLPPGYEGWDVGACGAAQWGRVGFCRAGKQRAPMWAMPALLASLQLRHTGWLFLTLAAQPLCVLAGSTISLAEMAVDSLGSTVEPGCALPGGHGSAGGFGSTGSEAGSVCVSACICVCVCKQWPCHAVPLHARLCQDRAEQSQFLLVLRRNRPPCSSVTQLQLLCCAVHSPVLCLKTGQGTGALPGL